MTSLDTFAAAVARMRTAQKDYFKKKTPSCFNAAKDAGTSPISHRRMWR